MVQDRMSVSINH